MLRIFCPKLYVSSVLEIDLVFLRQKGIKGILFDLDNTIVCREDSRCSPEVEEWLAGLRRHGFKTAIVSNNSARRVGAFARHLGIPSVHRAVKPLRWPFMRAVKKLGTTPQETAFIGDQIFTDILGGNLAGLYTILVTPLQGKEFLGTRLISRPLEKIILTRLNKQKGLKMDIF